MEDIETQKQKLIDLLYFYYKKYKNEKVRIETITLKDAGFGNLEQQGFFFRVICPSLEDEGILKNFIPLQMTSFLPDHQADLEFFEKAYATNKDGWERMKEILKKNEHDFWKSHDAGKADRYYSFYFKVDGKKLEEEFEKTKKNEGHGKAIISQDKNSLKSLDLVTTSLQPTSVIFLVINELYKMPIRFPMKNKNGEEPYIKKLYNIAYIADAPDKKVAYDKGLADRINNGLFRKRKIADFMRTNKFKKPTLVQKSEDKKNLVLKNEVVVKDILVSNIPTQYRYLYIDKTK